MIDILDFMGTFTFAYFGAHVGIRRRFDIFGIFVVGFLTAVGGGTIREIFLGNLPSYFQDIRYLFCIVLGCGAAIALYRISPKLNAAALYVDALGLVLFAFIGAEKAMSVGLGVFGVMLFAVVSGVGGGLLRDIAIAETPQIFYRDVYALPAIILGFLYFVFLPQSLLEISALIASTWLLRALAIYFAWDLWGPYRNG